jgi:hypothetical protein
MCSYDGKKTFYHEWLGNKKKDSTNNKRTRFLSEIYPDRKDDEIELMAKLYTDKELKALARDYGMDEPTIAKKFK